MFRAPRELHDLREPGVVPAGGGESELHDTDVDCDPIRLRGDHPEEAAFPD